MARDRPVLLAALVGACAAAGAGAGLLALDGQIWPAAAIVVVAAGALVGGWTVLAHHFDTLHQAEAAIAGIPAGGDPPPAMTEASQEIARLYATAEALLAPGGSTGARSDGRLSAIVGALPGAIVAITDAGLVSLVNGPARALFGTDAVAVGTSLFDALHRTPIAAARADARARGLPVEAMLETVDGRRLSARVADLGDQGGAVLVFASPDAVAAARLDHALDLHDGAAVGPAGPDTPLASLPAVVLDTETTGLDPTRDRVVSIGAVRLVGGRTLRAATFDRLVRPDMPIPARSSAIHGIDDAMVADAPPVADVLPALGAFVEGSVAIGHNIGFDLAIVAAEAARHGIAWSAPPSLCTMLLTAALDPSRTALDLSDVAAAHGVAVVGRHTALGDALVNAALYGALLPRLAAHGVTTLGEAVAFAQRAKRVRSRQKEAGW